MNDKVILAFCAYCGVLLPKGTGEKNAPKCENCGELVTAREERIEGLFEPEEAERLRNL